MDRLTTYYDGNHGKCERIGCSNHNTESCILAAEEQCESLRDIIDRLAAYEDTGLSPEEITAALSRLAEYDALRPDVLTFAKAMEAVLKIHDDRPGWENETNAYLYGRLLDEIDELRESGDKSELLDVANFCMMLYCNATRAAAAMEKGEGE